MPNILVIGYGNELRSDDGVGPRVATSVAGWNSPNIRAFACHQLTPELAEPIASASKVVFVDATVEPLDFVRLKPIVPLEASQVMTHTADPRSLLSLAKSVFGHCPCAWALTIPAANVGFGNELSALANRGVQAALDQIRTLVTR